MIFPCAVCDRVVWLHCRVGTRVTHVSCRVFTDSTSLCQLSVLSSHTRTKAGRERWAANREISPGSSRQHPFPSVHNLCTGNLSTLKFTEVSVAWCWLILAGLGLRQVTPGRKIIILNTNYPGGNYWLLNEVYRISFLYLSQTQ